MWKTHQEKQELIAARVSDYVNGYIGLATLEASIWRLEHDKDERRYIVLRAQEERLRGPKRFDSLDR